ncbi:PREDICTED: ankyrin repeat, PH and SEC7 domain containing protein secG-like, partial [Priapulus caudatus]|uniref:Ankyrin repeat, PH and SEC7 domain containing protein secG-like n=1 Tax=Priapulus caudatus TaxID=37621 RepID=A0ABM1F7E1_PRICU
LSGYELRPARAPSASATDEERRQYMQRQLADAIADHASMDDLRILLATGARSDRPVRQGLFPLHYAVYERYADAARLFLVRGGAVDSTDDVGYTAMHLAAEKGYFDMVRLLLEFGARVCFADPNPAELFPSRDQPEEPLRLAIKSSHYRVAQLLLQEGANPNT